ncbi:MAG: hypothetical protein GEU75_08065 [Dehalococcoidia bacterium]|nr:hypothetical protein [Dehalococcoidia bacterium]
MRILVTLASLFLAFLLFMTGARFLIFLFNVDRANEIVDWILRKSDFWVKPFFNLFGNRGLEETGGFFEPTSLIAFLVYLVVGGLIIGLLRSCAAGWGGGWGRLHRA